MFTLFLKNNVPTFEVVDLHSIILVLLIFILDCNKINIYKYNKIKYK